MEIQVRHPSELNQVVGYLLQITGTRKKILLEGDLGAGKTAFVQAFCAHSGVGDSVTSPTFSLVNEYLFKDESGNAQSIFHLDLYRIKSLDEALQIGIEEYLNSDSWCFVEWPEVILPIMPEDAIRIQVKIDEDSSRKFIFL